MAAGKWDTGNAQLAALVAAASGAPPANPFRPAAPAAPPPAPATDRDSEKAWRLVDRYFDQFA